MLITTKTTTRPRTTTRSRTTKGPRTTSTTTTTTRLVSIESHSKNFVVVIVFFY